MPKPPLHHIPSYEAMSEDERSRFWTNVLFFGGLALIFISLIGSLRILT